MRLEKTIGILLIAGAIGVIIPYSILTASFQYPDILRQDPGTVLTAFHQGGNKLLFTWLAFALLGLPLLVAYVLIGQLFANRSIHMRWITIFGVVSGVVQIIGLLRWVFVVPVIADSYLRSNNEAARQASILAFNVVHQFGGVLLGEHIGQLFTIIWSIMISIIMLKLCYLPRWVSIMGLFSSAIYLMAQAELFGTIIHGFPVWNAAGFIGSSLWLAWLVIVGLFLFIRRDMN